MQERKSFLLRPALAVLTVAASAVALAGASEAAPAETCFAAPKGVAPQGQHWYYRLERPSMRKCWYLAEKGRRIAKPAAAAQAEPGEDEETPTAPVANVPAAPATIAAPPPPATAAPVAAAPAPVTEQPTATPVITTLVTRNVSNPSEVAQATVAPTLTQPFAVAGSASDTMAATEGAAASTASEQVPGDQPAPAAVAEPAPPPPAAAPPETTSASTETMSTLQLLLAAIALTAFLASGAFFVMAMLRRRKDVFSVRRETDTLPYEQSPEMAEEGPAFQPLRALDPIRQRDLDPMRQHDDVDEILQRLARRRRAA